MELQRGRENQKLRTRRALIAAARDLIGQGRLPSVVEVAEAALVSPATAYRYFPDQLSLLRAALADALPSVAEIATPVHVEVADPEERVVRATETFLRLVLKQEALVRAVMALSLLESVESAESGEASGNRRAAAIRPGYRLAWITEALAPLEGKIDPAAFEQLSNALALVVSSEALVALQDVSGLEAEAAVGVCVWAARTLVHAVVADHTTGASQSRV
jgi:AcrR family transcriptional regulator